MREVILILVASFFLTRITDAQVKAEVILDQDQFIPGETIPVSVRVVNRSGQVLKLGAEPSWLTFSVEGKEALTVEKTGEVPVLGEFTLESSKMATKTVDITPWFTLSKPGRYSITAMVRIPGWDRVVVSDKKSLQISKGTKLWEVEFGVPKREGQPQGAPEVRKYALMKSAQLDRTTLFAKVTDISGAVLLKVTPIGSLVSFSDPEKQLDRFSNLHVLWQNGARTYTFATINPEGQLLTRQTYDFEGIRPKLATEENGRIHVIGGERRKSSTDVPPQ